METWVNASGLQDYEVSDYGNVRSKDRNVVDSMGRLFHRKGKNLKPYKNTSGYYTVSVRINNRSLPIRIHRLVYESFKGKIPEGLVVDHINNIKTDNRLENLQVITNAENLSKDTWRHKDLPLGVFKSKDRKKYVSHYSAENKVYYLGTFDSAEEAHAAYVVARKNYEENGTLPVRTKVLRNQVTNGEKACTCCGRSLPLSSYYISRGRIQGKCKECFKQERKDTYNKRKGR